MLKPLKAYIAISLRWWENTNYAVKCCKLLIQSFYFNTLISCVGICWWKFHLRTTRLMKLCQVHVSMKTSRTLYKRPMGTMEGLVLPDL